MTRGNWIDSIPAEDKETYRRAGFGGTRSVGKRPALIVVDVTYGFTGSRGLTLQEAIAEFSTACGPVSWEAVPQIASLLRMAREAGWRIVFSRSDAEAARFTGKATKSKSMGTRPKLFDEFPPDIAPTQGEWILPKTRASCFFGTPLSTGLIRDGIDSLVFCGVSTSGCVRASVVDGFSHGFQTIVVDDCCFDRSWYAHCSNLFDMDAKYATVVSLRELGSMIGTAQKVDETAG
jgi:maleamate amidohydrolase